MRQKAVAKQLIRVDWPERQLEHCTAITQEETDAIDQACCSMLRDDNLNKRVSERLAETLERLKERLQ
jgi:biotin synthase-related radical SAM superfamily protein